MGNERKEFHRQNQDMSPFVSLSILFDFKYTLAPKYTEEFETVSSSINNKMAESMNDNGMTTFILITVKIFPLPELKFGMICNFAIAMTFY